MKKKFLLPVVSGMLCLAFAFSLAACGDEPPEGGGGIAWNDKEQWMTAEEAVPTSAAVLPDAPTVGSPVMVHDPSAFFDPVTQKYYAFGSHFAVASSEDLIKWKQEYRDNYAAGLYGTSDFRSVIPESSAFAGTGGGINSTWAPDVEYIDGKYYMYYSLTSAFGSAKSVIGRVEADNVLGPYANEKVIVKSNYETGSPNAIDPELFYDKEDRLWMVYGSFYGGIFIKELYAEGESAGLPIEEEGFGTLLWKRGFSRGVEGPFIFYNAQTDYYYLMVSEGDLNGEYNMRVARSKSPNGPYVDATGNDVSTDQGRGNKIAGNYKFASDSKGYGAMGHNSVVKKDGQYYVVYHTRYGTSTISGGGHNVQVNQLFFNEEGWPVMSPQRYAGETRGTVAASDVAGNYELVLHSENTTSSVVASEAISLTADGKVMRGTAEAGTWTLKSDYYVDITVDNVVYKGVVAPVWHAALGKASYSLTAVSNTGRSLWANKL
ncbi:MAG: glycoside hydrolase family 43 protein [Clostridia bacterium]|nr:glycoside hydrolase family 43 protein [Clostridia bacterium]